MKFLKVTIWFFTFLLIGFTLMFVFYFNNISDVDPITKGYYETLKQKLHEKGFDEGQLFVVSGKRSKWHNDLLHHFKTGAAKNSYHLHSKAIDVIVRDVNKDGKSDQADVLIVKSILENEVVKNKGGVGIYQKSDSYFSGQMVHFDCRGYKARWNY